MSTVKKQQAALAAAVVAYCGNCDNLGALLPTVLRIAERHVSVDVLPEQYAVVGGVLLQALEEVLGKEVFNDEVKTAITEGYFFLADIFINMEKEKKAAKDEAEGGWSGWRSLKVVRKVQETSKHMSLYLAPEAGEEVMAHLAGQYLTLRIHLADQPWPMVRHYSISSGPGTIAYRITVKREEEGAISSYLHDKLQEGDMVDVSAPCGDFLLVQDSSLPLVLVGAGVGITPLFSILTVAATLPSVPTTLIYRVHDRASMPLAEELFTLVSPWHLTPGQVENHTHLSLVISYTVGDPAPKRMSRWAWVPAYSLTPGWPSWAPAAPGQQPP